MPALAPIPSPEAAQLPSPHPLKVLILGGYGNFGARIARALAGDARMALHIGGRSLPRAEALARSLPGGARALAVDAGSTGLPGLLRDEAIGLVIHTAGPFQAQGYHVAQACATVGAHYIDLADGRRFVCDFPAALGAAFASAGRVGISGASTVPALSSAVVDALTAGWRAVHGIDICIAPAQSAPRGVATLAGVLSYCGAPIRIWQGGRWQSAIGWAQPERVAFARLRPRLGALCDIPDLELFPPHYAVRDAVMFRAALEVPLSQRSFAWLAALRRAGVLRRPEKLAALLHAVSPVMDRLGSALGGMVVQVRGEDAQGQPAQARWDIAADDDHGPEIPCMAAILLARRLAAGEGPAPRGYTATGLLPLDAFAPEFARWGMVVDRA